MMHQPPQLDPEAAVHKLTELCRNAVLALQQTDAGAQLEWEFRFESFRPDVRSDPAAASGPGDHCRGLQHDEFLSAVRTLQQYGWRAAADRPEVFTRWSFPMGAAAPPYPSSSSSSSARARITAPGSSSSSSSALAGGYGGAAAPIMEYCIKADDVVGGLRTFSAARDLQALFHVRTSMQSERTDRELSQREVRERLAQAERRAATAGAEFVERRVTRTALIHPRFPALRIDCSEVVQGGGGGGRGKGVWGGSPHRFEIELEVLPAFLRDLVASHVVAALRHVVLGLQFSTDQMLLTGPRWRTLAVALQRTAVAANVRPPQPVSVRTDHIEAIANGEFAVTAKVDGQRCLLFLFEHRLYRVDACGRIIPVPVGVAPPHPALPFAAAAANKNDAADSIGTCLFDAEFVVGGAAPHTPCQPTTKDKEVVEVDSSGGNAVYHVFDLYYAEASGVKTPGVTTMPFSAGAGQTPHPALPTRYALAREILARVQWEPLTANARKPGGAPRIVLKDMVFPTGTTPETNEMVFDFIRRTLDADDASNGPPLDGLIFTSVAQTLPLAGSLSGHPHLHPARWPGAVKYKARADTTIDFQLGTDPTTASTSFPLLVFNAASGTLVPFAGTLPDDDSGTTFGTLARQHAPAHLVPGNCCECTFDLETRTWRFVRLRLEKRRPNAVDVAYANWDLIHTPIELPRSAAHARLLLAETQKGYYDRISSCDASTSNVRFFHNTLKRAVLATLLAGRRDGRLGRATLVDLGVGRGGDIAKYQAHFRALDRVVGIDPDADNLRFARERYVAMMRSRGPEHMFPLLLIHGAAQWWGAGAPHTPPLAGPLQKRAKTTSSTIASSTALPHRTFWESGGVGGAVAPHRYDIAVMHFAVHYLWGCEADVDQFVSALRGRMREDGWVVLSTWRGPDVARALAAAQDATVDLCPGVSARASNFDPRERAFTEDDCFGFEIEVTNPSLRTHGDALREFLVHPQVLVRKMRRLGGFVHVPTHAFFNAAPTDVRRAFFAAPLTPLDDSFQDIYCKWTDAARFPVPVDQLATYSGWNSLFIFRVGGLPPHPRDGGAGAGAGAGLETGAGAEWETGGDNDGGSGGGVLGPATQLSRKQPKVRFANAVVVAPHTRFEDPGSAEKVA